MNHFVRMLSIPLIGSLCLIASGVAWQTAPPTTQPATQATKGDRHIVIALLQDYDEVRGLSEQWARRQSDRLYSTHSEYGDHSVTISVPGIGAFASSSKWTKISQRDGRISYVTILPLEEALPLDEIEAYLIHQLAEWKLEPTDGDSLKRMMELVREYVPKQGQPTISDLVIDGEKVEIDMEKVNKIGVPRLHGIMWIGDKEPFTIRIDIRPLLTEKSKGFVSITFAYRSYRLDEESGEIVPTTLPATRPGN